MRGTRPWALGLLLAAGACGTDEAGLPPTESDGTRRSSAGAGEVATERGAPAPVPMPASAPMPAPASADSATVVVRAEKLAARRIAARVIYAEKIEAGSAAVIDLRKDDGKLWQTGAVKAELSYDELRADTIYAKEIRADELQAVQAFVKELKVVEDEDGDGDGGNGNGKAKDKN